MENIIKFPVIAGVQITTDAEGRFNLNLLHKASETAESKKPSEWLRTNMALELINELSGNSRLGFKPVSSKKGGKTPGTFAHELLAISYAGWISPAFQLKVNQVFIDYRKGQLPPDPAKMTRFEILQLAMQAEQENQQLKNKIQDDSPKVEFYDEFTNHDGLFGLQNAARALHVRPNKFVQWLKEEYLFYQGGALIARAPFIRRGLFEIKTQIIDDTPRLRTWITPKGLQFLAKKIKGCAA